MMTYLYTKTPLVSPFALASPEEDFVETFKYYSLASAQVGIDLNITGIASKVVSRVKVPPGSGIGDKVSCIFTKLLPGMPPPTVNK
jgi:hypothetical protein